MAKPEIVEIPHNQFIKVASSVNVARLIKLQGSKQYYQTYRSSGDTAPNLPINLDNPREPVTEEWVLISKGISQFESDNSSDVYVYCTGGESSENGFLRIGVLS